MHDEASDEVEIAAWIDVVGNAGRHDGEDCCGALAADVEPGK